jgi:hypothetical protein
MSVSARRLIPALDGVGDSQAPEEKVKMTFALNVLVSAFTIATAAALSSRYPVSAGFLVALPLSTMLVLPLSYSQHGDATATFTFAKSILLAIPITFLFFTPLLLAERLGLSFWLAYLAGCALLPVGFLVHAALGRVI